MIKLFRKIRQKMLTENKFSKYLLYAIGEIILVVIGILLAININIHSSDKARIQENRKLLNNLLFDLDKEINQLHYYDTIGHQLENYYLPSLKEQISINDSVIKLMNIGLRMEHMNFVLSTDLWRMHPILEETSTYDQLISTGKLYDLGSQKMTDAISSYFKSMKKNKWSINNEENEIRKAIDLTLTGHGKMYSDYTHNPNFNISEYPWLFDPYTSEYYKMEYLARTSSSMMKAIRGRMHENIRMAKNLKAHITKEFE